MENSINNEIWGKTLISIYRFLPAIAEAIDNLIKKKTINSIYCNSNFQSSTYEIANSVIELTERKVKLINIKVVLEKAINNLKPNDKKLLVLYYVDNIDKFEIMNIFKISQRTFFRRKELALKSLGKQLSLLGYNHKKLKKYLSSEHWLINTYNKYAAYYFNKSNSDVNAINYRLLKNVMFEINNPYKESFNNYKFSS